MNFKFNSLHVFLGIGFLVAFFALAQTFKMNHNGFRTVVQWPTGHTFVKSTPGFYIAAFGTTETYPDYLTHDLGGEAPKDAVEGVVYGVNVRYQDGGTGTIDGVVRVNLPNDHESMLSIHRAFRSAEGIREKLLIPEIRQALNLTAGLMTSEEAYAERRADLQNWSSDQIQNGVYKTRLVEKEIISLDGSAQTKRVPQPITSEDGGFIHQESPLDSFSITVAQFQVTDWGFEQKTLDQINAKREAEMEAIKLEALARQAVAEQTQITAQGKAEVERVKYAELQVAERATIAAERDKEVAVIEAQKVKETNAELLEAAKIDVQTAKEQKQAAILRADGEAYAKQAVMEADGALQLKLDAAVSINEKWAEAYANRKVPSMVMGADGVANGGTDTDAAQFQQMLNALLAKDLLLDMDASK